MKGKWIALAVMILIGIVLSTWWYAYIYIYHQEMASYVFHKESSSWSNHNVRSWYYYWQFFLETGVWLSLIHISNYPGKKWPMYISLVPEVRVIM